MRLISQLGSRLGHAGPSIALRRAAMRSRGRVNDYCPLCGHGKSSPAFRDNGCSLRVCGRCELFFVSPYPGRAEQHGRVSCGGHSEIEILDCARRHAGEKLYYGRHFAQIAAECERARSLLDVGCGTGHLLERFTCKPKLYRAGIELNAEAAEYARRAAKCEIFQVPIEEFRSARAFDVITMINVFSHIPSLDGMFAAVKAALRPGGKLILRTTEMSRNVSRWNQVHWGVPDDLHFLGLNTLKFVCKKYGFAVGRHERTPHEDELFRVSRWQQEGRSAFINRVKRVGLRWPGIRVGLRNAYAARLGRRLFVSFIVLTPVLGEGSGT